MPDAAFAALEEQEMRLLESQALVEEQSEQVAAAIEGEEDAARAARERYLGEVHDFRQEFADFENRLSEGEAEAARVRYVLQGESARTEEALKEKEQALQNEYDSLEYSSAQVGYELYEESALYTKDLEDARQRAWQDRDHLQEEHREEFTQVTAELEEARSELKKRLHNEDVKQQIHALYKKELRSEKEMCASLECEEKHLLSEKLELQTHVVELEFSLTTVRTQLRGEKDALEGEKARVVELRALADDETSKRVESLRQATSAKIQFEEQLKEYEKKAAEDKETIELLRVQMSDWENEWNAEGDEAGYGDGAQSPDGAYTAAPQREAEESAAEQSRPRSTDDAPAGAATAPGADRDVIMALTAAVAALSQAKARPEESDKNDDKFNRLLESLTETSRESGQKILGQMPKITANDADSLREELKLMRRFFNDAKVTDKRNWFKKFRNTVTGNAISELNYVIAHDMGGEEAYQAKLAEADPEWWEEKWHILETRWKRAAFLDDETELSGAVQRYGNLSLRRDAKIAEVAKFLQEYT